MCRLVSQWANHPKSTYIYTPGNYTLLIHRTISNNNKIEKEEDYDGEKEEEAAVTMLNDTRQREVINIGLSTVLFIMFSLVPRNNNLFMVYMSTYLCIQYMNIYGDVMIFSYTPGSSLIHI